MPKPIIEIRKLCKKYKIGTKNRSYYPFRDMLLSNIKNPLKLFDRRKNKEERSLNNNEIWALHNVSFKVMSGEMVGIIGKNGSGKSTLLKILSQITPPTFGEALLRGRVASLLEIGTGFNPDLSGRENIYLNGSILGMSHREIKKNFKEITEFAGIGRFIDTPVKHYSSGMHMRLAFAVAANLDAEILLIDEVLAVGDYQFQKKCLDKMSEITKGGRTVLLVSHSMGAISSLTDRVLWFDSGKLIADGEVAMIVPKYISSSYKKAHAWKTTKLNKNTMQILEMKFKTFDGKKISSEFFKNQKIKIEIKYVVRRLIKGAVIAVNIHASDGTHLISLEDSDRKKELLMGRNPDTYVTSVSLPTYLLNDGDYLVRVSCGIPKVEFFDNIEVLSFSLVESKNYAVTHYRKGYFIPMLEWETDLQ